jgi:nucleoside-diphosphate-sugar epimerase
MKILVTGSTGFIGNRLINKLKKNRYKFSNLTKIGNRNKLKAFSNILINKSIVNSKKKISNFNASTVIHLATNFQKKQNLNLIPQIISDNILFGSLLLEILNKKKLKLFININTTHTSVNGKTYDPKDFYSASKKSYENILFWYSKKYNFKVINLHLSDTYGEKDKRDKILDLLLKSVKKNLNFTIQHPNQEINYTHVDDVCDAIISLLTNKSKNNWIDCHLFSKETLTLIKLKEKIEKVLNKKTKVKFKNINKKTPDFKFKPKYRLIKNWKQKITLKDGILKVYKYS